MSRASGLFPKVITAVLAAWLAVDLGGRLLPTGWLGILPEHTATRRPGKYHPFIPNLSIWDEHWTGESATTGNLKPTETRGPVQFSTDRRGYRLTPGLAEPEDIRLILRDGASFAYGGGLSDEETLPAVLTRQGLPVYNGGRFFWDPATWDQLDWLVRQFPVAPSGVIALAWEQTDYTRSQLDGLTWGIDQPGAALLGPARYQEWRETLQYGRRYWRGFWHISPLEILCIRAFKALSNDWLLPNRYRDSVVVRETPKGKRLVFLASEKERSLHPPLPAAVRDHADFFAYYRQRLRERKLELYVVLLPNRYTVYGPLLGDAAAASPYLHHLENQLTERAVPVLNMLPEFQRSAREDLARDQLPFYREDHHWTPLGVRRTAAAFQRKFFPSGAR